MAELLKAPELMSKAKKELNQVIGKGNQVKESDITQLEILLNILSHNPFLSQRGRETANKRATCGTPYELRMSFPFILYICRPILFYFLNEKNCKRWLI